MASITYTKKDIVRRTAGKINVSQDDMKVIFDSTIDTIKDIFMEQQSNIRIEIRNFGVFEIKPTKAKPKARNPQTNQEIFVPAHKKTHFKPGKILRQYLKQPLK